MDAQLFSLLELGLFFVFFVINLQLFKALRFEEIFKKGKINEIQLLYFFTVIIFTYLLTKSFSFLFSSMLFIN